MQGLFIETLLLRQKGTGNYLNFHQLENGQIVSVIPSSGMLHRFETVVTYFSFEGLFNIYY